MEHISSVGDVWYRYDDVQYAAPLDEWEVPIGESRVALRLTLLTVTKVTPCGVWLDGYKFILIRAKKQYARHTKQEALTSFLARKERQLGILGAHIHRVQTAVTLAKCLDLDNVE